MADAPTAEHFAATVNQLKGKVTMLFIAHAIPKNLQVYEIVRIGATLNAIGIVHEARVAVPDNEVEYRQPLRVPS
jgi:subfamily B ATP-binding cassette protein HlyB/CyaB